MAKEKKKTRKKLNEVLASSQSPNNGALAISFQKDTVLVNGVSSNSIKPHLAILHASIDGNETFQHWTPVIESTNKSVILAFNLAKNYDPILYTLNLNNSKDEAVKFDKNQKINEDDFVILYWEVADYSFFSMIFRDPNSDQTIIECQFNTKYTSKIYYRKLLSVLLPKKYANEIEKVINKSEDKKILIGGVKDNDEDENQE